MNLIIDIGNTFTKLVIFDANNRLIEHRHVSKEHVLDEIKKLHQKYAFSSAIISRVGKRINRLDQLLQDLGVVTISISASMRLPFRLAYDSPQTIGADRLALVAGAMYHRTNQNQLIIDAGTCVTYDFIDENNVYHGGAISPGLQLRFKALNDYTANLPLLYPGDKPVDWLGKNTESSIKAGVIWGLVHEIEGFIVKYNLKYADLTVYLTGGDQKLLDRYIKNKIFVGSKFLLWEGMNLLLNLNK